MSFGSAAEPCVADPAQPVSVVCAVVADVVHRHVVATSTGDEQCVVELVGVSRENQAVGAIGSFRSTHNTALTGRHVVHVGLVLIGGGLGIPEGTLRTGPHEAELGDR